MIVGVIIKYGSFQPSTKPPHVEIINTGNNTYPDDQAPESVLLSVRNKSMTIKYNIWGEVTEENKALSQLVMAVSAIMLQNLEVALDVTYKNSNIGSYKAKII